ncbi:hypothetical protein [Candidimonas nitroreducens]|uniref:Uncharacterized protein n=1 Tax=Candidimonas nitroreducens TaxID=683354 RepID=A0A225M559_9BURK|nr:hypothetical protein [Candidimonas nitroreducens]OWT55260.1 hypothetical protein CEY11_21355 [Candidimonas nitroreducens]
MTVIAWDGETLAADKRAVDGAGAIATTTKIWRCKNALLAVTGSWDVGVEMREWWASGAGPEKFPEVARKNDASLIVFSSVGIEEYCAAPYPMLIEDSKYAAGTGRKYALAAMACGKSAMEAVEIACRFQSDCGNGVDVLRLHPVEIVRAKHDLDTLLRK